MIPMDLALLPQDELTTFCIDPNGILLTKKG